MNLRTYEATLTSGCTYLHYHKMPIIDYRRQDSISELSCMIRTHVLLFCLQYFSFDVARLRTRV